MNASKFFGFAALTTIVLVIAWSCAQSGATRDASTQFNGVSEASIESQSIMPIEAQDKHPEADFSLSCYECHNDVTPEQTQLWYESKHGQVNVGCFICHGDGEAEFFREPQVEVCATCHAAQQVDFSQTEASSCFSCHQGHSLQFHL